MPVFARRAPAQRLAADGENHPTFVRINDRHFVLENKVTIAFELRNILDHRLRERAQLHSSRNTHANADIANAEADLRLHVDVR